MARTVNEEDFAAKRGEILDVAQRLIYTKGYERMAIQDILDDLQISKGAFYHYFKSKPMVLEALIERIQQEMEQALLAVIDDPGLNALEKLQHFFATIERFSTMHKAFVADLLRVWFADDNAIVREKMYEAMTQRRTPLLTAIIHQGIQEGVFETPYPDQVAEVILSLARGMGSAIARLMLSLDQEPDEQSIIETIVATYSVYADSLERILATPSGALPRPTVEAVRLLVTTLRNG